MVLASGVSIVLRLPVGSLYGPLYAGSRSCRRCPAGRCSRTRAGREHVGREQALDAVLHVRRGDGRAVLPLDAGPEVVGPRLEVSVVRAGRGRDVGHDLRRARLGLVGHQRAHVEPGHVPAPCVVHVRAVPGVTVSRGAQLQRATRLAARVHDRGDGGVEGRLTCRGAGAVRRPVARAAARGERDHRARAECGDGRLTSYGHAGSTLLKARSGPETRRSTSSVSESTAQVSAARQGVQRTPRERGSSLRHEVAVDG